MKYAKRPKYKIDISKVPLKTEKDLEGGEIYKEMLRAKKKKARW